MRCRSKGANSGGRKHGRANDVERGAGEGVKACCDGDSEGEGGGSDGGVCVYIGAQEGKDLVKSLESIYHLLTHLTTYHIHHVHISIIT